MTPPEDAVLLDTCAVIWLANGDPMLPQAMLAIRAAGFAQAIHVSPISAWEIGLLSRPRPNRSAELHFQPDPKAWFARFMSGPGIREASFTPDIAIEASHLPGELHGDPADRLIIATARHFGLPVITRDRKIIAYGETGFVGVIPC
jgi:PIN domain nuclease of toxin-antitoxin system